MSSLYPFSNYVITYLESLKFSCGSFLLHVERAFVFFSSPISKELVMHIKRDTTVLPRISALREVISLL